MGGLSYPEQCKCCRVIFNVEYDANSKTSKVTFRRSNYKCRNGLSIRNNSFYVEFPKIRLYVLTEVLKYFLIYEMNAVKARQYIIETLKEIMNIETIRKIYTTIRDTIKKYLYIQYEFEILGEKNQNDIFGVDESLFSHTYTGEQAWVLGIINNTTKDIRLQVTKERNCENLKKFIKNFIDIDNKIVSDC